ncbi:MAG: aromatic amino acid lyase, partial [Planctomycetota bacterium]
MLRVSLGEDLTAETFAAIARGAEVRLVFGRDARARVKKARATVDAIVKKGAPVYGVNTGFGALAKERISPEDTGTLQRNLLLSHAVGVGEDLPAEVKRLALILRIHSL